MGSNGQITGNVTPTFNVAAVLPSDSGGHIDDFDAAVVSVNATGQSFVIQGPHGHNFTVQVTGQTEFDNGERLGDLTTSSIVEISGIIQTADKIKTPILLIHGEADDNTGTYPVQSERFYAALKGQGATVRLVFLPLEPHAYGALETKQHVLWEIDRWMVSMPGDR